MNLKNAKDNKKTIKAVLAVSIAAVMLIPMLYSSIYLGAFWDPYGNLDKVPVAFVNLDKPITKDGKEYTVGRDLENNLKDNKSVDWKFVSYNAAQQGVTGSSYYAMVEIPEDFSQKIADAQDGKFNSPEIVYEGNKGRNFIFSQISERVAESIKSEVSTNIQKEITKTLVDSLQDVKVSIKDAASGAGELQSGTGKLFDGSKQLADNIGQAASGSVQLQSGLKQAQDGAAGLQDGTKKLLDGSSNLSSGLNSAAGGSAQLQNGFKTLIDGEGQVVDGSTALVNGLKELKSNLTQSSGQASKLVQGASDLNTNAAAISQGADQLDTSVGTLTSGINQADSTLHDELANIDSSNLSPADKAQIEGAISALDQISRSNTSGNSTAPLTTASSSVHQLAGSLQQLKAGTQQVSDGVNQLVGGLTGNQGQAASGLDQLITGAEGIQGGSSKILTGLNTASEKNGELSKGLGQLSSGSKNLEDGLKTANAGSADLKNGLNTAVASTGQLSGGLKQLSSGSGALSSGIKDANNGAVKLKDGLNSGNDKLNGNLKFNSEDMSKFVSAPVSLKNTSINDVKNYGDGLAPYFVSLSLWLGAMFINLILSIIKKLDVVENKFLKSFIGKFAAGSILSIVQSIILSFVLITALKIDTTSIISFYLTNMFISVVFFSVMYGVSHAIGIIGTPIMFIVFLLQLSSSAGTFPIETAPAFYKTVGRIFPMTYSIKTLRMIISGINSSELHKYIFVLLGFMAIFMVGGYAVKALINVVKKEDKDLGNVEMA